MRSSILIIFILMLFSSSLWADVHLIIYATYNGNTGHCGIAVDDYKIVVKETIQSGHTSYYYDTINTGTLKYYDFWPFDDVYKGQYNGDVKPLYYRLPSTTYKQLISLKTLADQGVPHKFGYPCDAIISIQTTNRKDFEMIDFLERKINEFKSFNSMQHNCCDFVTEALAFLTGKDLVAKEFIVKDFVTTPNELYKNVSLWPGITIVKNPGDKVNGTFFQERILARILPLLNAFQLFIIIPHSL